MNCYFCQQEIKDATDLGSTSRLYGVCAKCPHVCSTFTYHGDPSKTAHSHIHFEYKDFYYRATFDIQLGIFKIDRLWPIGNDVTTQSSRVMSLPFVPTNITPHNIIRKFPTLVVFS